MKKTMQMAAALEGAKSIFFGLLHVPVKVEITDNRGRFVFREPGSKPIEFSPLQVVECKENRIDNSVRVGYMTLGGDYSFVDVYKHPVRAWGEIQGGDKVRADWRAAMNRAIGYCEEHADREGCEALTDILVFLNKK